MKISKKGLYAIEALMYLTNNYEKGLIPIHKIAEEENIPKKFLEQILLVLRNADIVESEKGKEGGYRLKNHPKETSLGKVIRLIDGPLAPLSNAKYLEEMSVKDEKHCGLYRLLLEVRNCAARLLDQTSFYDLSQLTEEIKGKKQTTQYTI
jgi:Rrf2 family protein